MIKVEAFFEKKTWTCTYIVYDTESLDALIIDPVLDFDQPSGEISFKEIQKYKEFIEANKLKLLANIETHAHADHLSASHYLKSIYPDLKIAIGSGIKDVQETFVPFFNLENIAQDGSQFDLLLEDGKNYNFGSLETKIISTPGHTPACISIVIEENIFTGDALFMEDQGTGRCDFPKGSAEDLYHSIFTKLYELPDSMKVFVGHDYGPGGREIKWETTLKKQKEANIQLTAKTSKEEFVSFRTTRDAKLNAPKLLLPSIQFNINAGYLPEEKNTNTIFLKLPLTFKGDL
jgi:glyoxylase-like metal-dependent hydrolase (beta-lactamase superfamily II)